jgi:hypothetical protein
MCALNEAKEEFSSGAKKYSKYSWRGAILDLQKAADHCPVPQNPILVSVFGFKKFNYAPFYYLGRSHKEINELPEALRYLYLSSCFDKVKEYDDDLKKRPTLTETFQKQTANLKQPDKKPPSFIDGYAAVQQEDWQLAAEKMWGSMQIWSEDGATTTPAGRWPEQYVPRFHLGKALFELGCRRQACEQLQRSQLKALAAADPGKYKDEIQDMEKLEAQCAKGQKGAYENEWICQQWICLLQQERGVAP